MSGLPTLWEVWCLMGIGFIGGVCATLCGIELWRWQMSEFRARTEALAADWQQTARVQKARAAETGGIVAEGHHNQSIAFEICACELRAVFGGTNDGKTRGQPPRRPGEFPPAAAPGAAGLESPGGGCPRGSSSPATFKDEGGRRKDEGIRVPGTFRQVIGVEPLEER